MKKISLSLTLFSLLLFVNGCKKKTEEPLSAKIQRIISTPVLDDMKAKGLVINEGNQPPNVEGIYLASPWRLLSPFGPDDNYKKGEIINDYKYRFYNQQGDDVKLDFKNNGNDEASGVASFLAGSGSKFSLFGEQTGVSLGISYKLVSVISGELTASGIKNFQYAFVFTEKGPDPTGKLIAVGKARIWEDGNALADKISAYRLAVGADSDEPGTGLATGAMAGNR